MIYIIFIIKFFIKFKKNIYVKFFKNKKNVLKYKIFILYKLFLYKIKL